ncbi:hypothetical protein [Salinarimonas sp.]|uniref:hypothetical protein n=1 Tax=Salinarimonas sp. TaxID=2766526 RepID=UPI00391A0485
MKPVVILLAAVALAGCASRASDINASYVSPLTYQNLTCSQLQEEAARVSNRAAIAVGAQNERATRDAVATGVSIVLFWPALFFVRGDGPQAAELARLKGEMDAIEQASIAKNCGIRFEREPPPAAPAPVARDA